MRNRFFASVLALLLLACSLCGCVEEKRAGCPITEYDSEKTIDPGDGIRVSLAQKKMSLEDEDAELVLVKNETDIPVDLFFTAKYDGNDGRHVMINNKIIEGFPAHYSCFLIFRPELHYSACTLFVNTNVHEGDTPMQYISTGYDLGLLAYAGFDLFSGYDVNIDDNLITEYLAEYRVESSAERKIRLETTILGIDTNGDPFFVAKGSTLNVSGDSRYGQAIVEFRDKPWDDDMTLPDNLLGDLYCIVAIESTQWEDEYLKKTNDLLEQYKNQIGVKKDGNEG